MLLRATVAGLVVAPGVNATIAEGPPPITVVNDLATAEARLPRRVPRIPLPIDRFVPSIVAAVQSSRGAIVTAPTGTGKSLRIPAALVDAGFNVHVSEPRRLAASRLAERQAEEFGEAVGGQVGYATRFGRVGGSGTRLWYKTDGLVVSEGLVRALGPSDVLIIDEFHERNDHVDMILALAREALLRGAQFKLVVMSATIEAGKLNAFLPELSVISIDVPHFPIVDHVADDTMERVIAQWVREGESCLVFLPGKPEIAALSGALRRAGVGAEIVPLHAELPLSVQAAAFKTYPRPKVVLATNVAQTTLTVPGISVVIDSGLERRASYHEGVETLAMGEISQADRDQRRGRAGREGPGHYIDFCRRSLGERARFSTPAMQRKNIDRVVLRAADYGYRFEDLPLLDPPTAEQLRDAREALQLLGCLDVDGRITECGRKVNQLPVGIRAAKILLEARELGVLPAAIDIVSAFEEGGVIDRRNERWRELLDWGEESDLIAEGLALQRGVRTVAGEGVNSLDDGRFVVFNRARLKRALENRDNLRERLSIKPTTEESLELQSREQRERLLRAILSGFRGCIWERRGDGYSRPGSPLDWRHLARDTVVSAPRFVVGVARDLDVAGSDGTDVVPIITDVTAIPERLMRVASPELLSLRGETGRQRIFGNAS